jgi:uncharacterized protein
MVDAVCNVPTTARESPCQKCGACCATFRVPVASAEIEGTPGGTVPRCDTDILKNGRHFMRGSGTKGGRCVALEGRIGKNVSCRIYDRRPTGCRNFAGSWEPGQNNGLCNRARSIHGLTTLSQF